MTMKTEMRNIKRKLSDEMTEQILENGLFGVLSTVGDGEPYGVPLSYAYKDGKIWFHCATEGHKLGNIAVNNNVCFTVVDSVETLAEKFSTKYRSAIAFGKIFVVDDPQEKMRGIEAIMMKYSSEYAAEGRAYIDKYFEKFKILRMDISELSGKGRLK